MEQLKRSELIQKAKEMKLGGYSKLKKEALIELINNHPSPPPHSPPEVIKNSPANEENRKVSLIDQSGVNLTFFSIPEAAKYFGINPGRFGVKLNAKSVKTRNSMTIKGILYRLHIE